MSAGNISVIILALVVLAGSAPAWACNCPKEYMIRQHGTVAAVPPTKPPLAPAAEPGIDPAGTPRQDTQSGLQ